MPPPEFRKPGLVVGLMLVLAIFLAIWLLTGRLRLFDTASRVELGFEERTEQYQQQILWLARGAQAQQEFVSKYPGLFRVDLFLTGLAQVDQEIDLLFHLRESCDSAADLRTVQVTVSNTAPKDNISYPITFLPIDESAGRTYCFLIEPEVGPEPNNRIGVYASSMDLYGQGRAAYQPPPETSVPPQAAPEAAVSAPYRLYLPLIMVAPADPNQADFDVSFHLHYRGRPLETISLFLTYLVQAKPLVWGSSWFYGLLLLLYVVGIYFLLRVKAD